AGDRPMQPVAATVGAVDGAVATLVARGKPPAEQATAGAGDHPERRGQRRLEVGQGEADGDDHRPHEIDRGNAAAAVVATDGAGDVVEVLSKVVGAGHGDAPWVM